MWQTLTLQRPKLRDKQAKGKQGAETLDKSRLRRAKTFCDNERFNEDEGKGNQGTWLKNIKNWRKRFLKTDVNFSNDNLDIKSRSVSNDSLDKIR